MIHFISSWYNPVRPWYTTDSVWFRSTARSQADDTVTQLRVFSQGDEDAGLVVLNYAPTLRRFLHAQDLFGLPYWSFFDEIQGLGDDYTRPLDFLSLDWPQDVSFYYNPFIVTVMQGSEVYARVYLAREGTLLAIRYYGAGMPTLARIFDDRGFLSSILMHDEEGRPATQFYLSRTGDVIVSEDVLSGQIDILQNDDDRFARSSYESWEALIAEFLGVHLGKRQGERDTVVLALSQQHNALVASTLGDQTLVLSRSPSRREGASSALLDRAGAVFTDVGQGDGEAEQEQQWAFLPELSIYPLERRATFGASTNESKTYIALFVDNITTDELDYTIATMAGQLVDDNARLLVCTFRSQDLEYLHEVRRVIGGYQRLDLAFLGDDIAGLSVDMGAADAPEDKIMLTFVDREAELIATMAKSRVLVDLGATVNYHLATEAVNAGVPQINRYQQDLVTHPINGYVIDDDSQLATALDHFLVGLEHWNQSLVQCRVLHDIFRAPEVLGRWDLIKEVAAYAGPADRA
ncbi:MAG: accessory Sec system protein Asp1 [Micrococcales bacterium]|nr:accessory Sec system protein Asp1 [Micrococcales bacterium]MCL2666249.1 accessory Sec system protein Asp1 [Micrococcales bacterium]